MSDPLKGWLDYHPSVKDTQFGLNDKWDKVIISRDIKKLTTEIIIPPFDLSFSLDDIDFAPSYIVAQLNFSLGQSFTILNWQNLPKDLTHCFYTCCIRWIDNMGNVFRRKLICPNIPGHFYDLLFVRDYAGEKIGGNFVLEFWTLEFNEEIRNDNPITLITSIFSVPYSARQTKQIATTPTFFKDLFVTIPIDIPQNFNPLGPWLSN